jgi:energy-coupling factor transport system ATP-binding protein
MKIVGTFKISGAGRMTEIIRTENLNFIYQKGTPFEFYALKDISISIKEGEMVGIIGPTGSGKSTLVQHFNGLLTPSSGKIFVAGRDISSGVKGKGKKGEQSIFFEVGLVFQYPEYQLFEETVYDDIAFGPRNMKLSEEEVKQRVKTAMDWMELDFDSMVNRSPFSLSGGEMRRVALAGVLAMQPRVLVLDEPTAGLDPKGREELFDRIRQFHDNLGMTLVMVTHEMGEVARMVDHLIIMNDGGIAADGKPAEIFEKHQQIRELGLELPPYMELMNKLKDAGFGVRTNVMDIDDAYDQLVKLFS